MKMNSEKEKMDNGSEKEKMENGSDEKVAMKQTVGLLGGVSFVAGIMIGQFL